MTEIANRTFRMVRKGFDPDEVRRYLLEIEIMINQAQPEQVVAAAQAQAEAIIAEAHRQVFAGPGPVAQPEAGAVQRADEIIAAAQAEAAAMVREAQAQAAGVDRWDGLGEHVARIVQQAEQEATAIAAEAELEAQAHTTAALADRAEAARLLGEARAEAADLVAAAEADAEALRASAEPQVRQHIASILADSQSDLELRRADLQAVLDQLEQVQGLLAQALAIRSPLPEFYAAERFLHGTAVAEDEPEAPATYEAPVWNHAPHRGGDVIAFPAAVPPPEPEPQPETGQHPSGGDGGFWAPPPGTGVPDHEAPGAAENPWGPPSPPPSW
ncbi:MAG: hypothetical protein JWM89_3210 [Acidimicrobiales bacterium]|nr:hypothetical protein [Acidimicrobiales bacterium]